MWVTSVSSCFVYRLTLWLIWTLTEDGIKFVEVHNLLDRLNNWEKVSLLLWISHQILLGGRVGKCVLWVCVCVCVWLAQLCPTLCSSMLLCPCNSPGKNTGMGSHSLLQGSSQPRDWTPVSCTAGFFSVWVTREASLSMYDLLNSSSVGSHPSAPRFVLETSGCFLSYFDAFWLFFSFLLSDIASTMLSAF